MHFFGYRPPSRQLHRADLPAPGVLLIGVLLIGVFLISACATPKPITPGSTRTSLLQDYKEQWQLVVPEGTELEQTADLYYIPAGKISDARISRRNLPLARESISSGLTQSLSLRRLGNEYWLLAEVPPSSVWPLLKEYWGRQEVAIAAEDALEGMMQSAEVEEAGERVSYRMKVEAGLRSSSTELYLQRLNAEGEHVHSENLVDRYRDILSYLSDTPNFSSSLLVQHLDFNPKMTTGNDENGYPYLLLRVSRERAWALLVKAIGELGWPRLAADAAAGVMEVEFRETVLREGWLPRWQGGPNADAGLSLPLPVSATTKKIEGHRLKGPGKTEQSRVRLLMQEAPEGIWVRIAPGDLSFSASIEAISELVQAVE